MAEPRGVWWRLTAPYVLELDFASRTRPPAEPASGPDWQWADETMTTTIPADLQLVPSTREPDPPIEYDGVYTAAATIDPETGAWVTDPTLPEFTDSGKSAEASPARDTHSTTDGAKGQVAP